MILIYNKFLFHFIVFRFKGYKSTLVSRFGPFNGRKGKTMLNSNFIPRALQQVPDSFQSYLVDGAKFTKDEEYPILEKDIISQNIPQYIMPFDKAITYRGNLKNTFICFYVADQLIERVRRNPKKYIAFFKRTAGIIGFDYSVHSDMPLVKQKSQMNDNLSLTYFFGKQGIPVIPNLRCGVNELVPEFLSAIPQQSYVAIGTHGFIKETWQQCEWYCFLDKVINMLSPKGIIVYGSLRNSMFNELKKKVPFYFYEPWICHRRKQVKSNVL